VNPELLNDQELEQEVARLRAEALRAAKNRIVHEARTERAFSPIETPPGRPNGGAVTEAVWLIVICAAAGVGWWLFVSALRVNS
jgi:hypothetical protein